MAYCRTLACGCLPRSASGPAFAFGWGKIISEAEARSGVVLGGCGGLAVCPGSGHVSPQPGIAGRAGDAAGWDGTVPTCALPCEEA